MPGPAAAALKAETMLPLVQVDSGAATAPRFQEPAPPGFEDVLKQARAVPREQPNYPSPQGSNDVAELADAKPQTPRVDAADSAGPDGNGRPGSSEVPIGGEPAEPDPAVLTLADDVATAEQPAPEMPPLGQEVLDEEYMSVPPEPSAEAEPALVHGLATTATPPSPPVGAQGEAEDACESVAPHPASRTTAREAAPRQHQSGSAAAAAPVLAEEEGAAPPPASAVAAGDRAGAAPTDQPPKVATPFDPLPQPGADADDALPQHQGDLDRQQDSTRFVRPVPDSDAAADDGIQPPPKPIIAPAAPASLEIPATPAAPATNGAPQVSGATTAALAPSSVAARELEFAQSNHERLVTAIRGQLLPRGGTMQIRLDPPQLGVLDVAVQMRDGIMSIAFATSSEAATRLLSHSLAQLKHMLESQGLTVERLHVQQVSRSEQAPRDTSEGDPQQRQDMGDESARQEHQRRELLRRMWRRVALGSDPLDLVA